MNNEKNGVQFQYKNWFLDYASYVILERAVPAIEDGLKPVQRRILHAMKEMDDGRFGKVANIIGQSMQYHPHGDASIGDAIVNIGQKDLLIETQGNWGDIRTGDDAAAARYIEARLSKFALETVFNNKTTSFSLSYDGRKKEPITLPVKFPLLLHQGVEGIAVGLSTKILPHNFCELLEASIKFLKGKKFELFPDFQTGGSIDISNYNDGKRGGKVRIRAQIIEIDKKTLAITSVPYSVTTTQMIESITKANDQGKIKIKKVIDITAKDIEIQIELTPGISPDLTIEALYAFTDCEISISPNACVIKDKQPKFVTVTELLAYAAEHTKTLLEQELKIKFKELEEQWHYTSLEKIFFEEKIYKELEKKHETWDKVISAIDTAFNPFKKLFKRPITLEDIVKLTEKPVRRIYKLDIQELIGQLQKIMDELANVQHHLNNLNDYAIHYFENLLKKYGKGKERKTIIKMFDTVEVKHIAIANTKVYINRTDGFIGTSLKKDEYLFDASEYDDIIAFTKLGQMKVVKVQDKTFIGKDIIYASIFKKNDERTTYNMIYLDGATNISFAKRFNVIGVTRDKEYILSKGTDKTKVHYFSANANGEAEKVRIILNPNCSARLKDYEYSFNEIEIKGRASIGNQLTKYPIKQIKFVEIGVSTLQGFKIWFDKIFGKLNAEGKGEFLGTFENEKIIIFYKNGKYEITDTDLIQRFEGQDILLIEKFNPESVFSAVYLDSEKYQLYIKRFKIETTTLKTLYLCIKEGDGNLLMAVTSSDKPILNVQFGKGSQIRNSKIKIDKMVEIIGWRSIGTKLTEYNKSIILSWEQAKTIQDESIGLFD